MADTGYLNGGACATDGSGACANLNDGDSENDYVVFTNVAQYWTGYTYSYGNFPSKMRVDGLEILANGIAGSGTKYTPFRVSIDDGSNYSDPINEDFASSQSESQSIGGSSQLWGLDWSDFDIGDLRIKLGANFEYYINQFWLIQVKIYYTEIFPLKLTLNSGKIIINGNKLTIG